MPKLKILILYSASEFPTRKTVWSYLYSFARHSDHLVYYHNYFFSRASQRLRLVDFDVVIFHHSFSTPWTRKRYKNKIKKLNDLNISAKYKIAFFQDEYFNSDLACEFVNQLKIDQVYTVAPKTEWAKIYKNVAAEQTKIDQVLTGYIDEQDLPAKIDKIERKRQRSIDIGYRTDWTSALYKLGSFGLLKYKLAKKINDEAKKHDLVVDVSASRKAFLKGADWFHFQKECRYICGTESGSSLLDFDGTINHKINSYLQDNPTADFNEVKNNCFADKDENLKLKVISPRHFESILNGCAQILVEGEYNNILQPNLHYIPLKEDFSNIKEVMRKVKDEQIRISILENTERDIIASGKYTYKSFVNQVLNKPNIIKPISNITIKDIIFYKYYKINDVLNWVKGFLFCKLSVIYSKLMR